jgi:hypothetical protein
MGLLVGTAEPDESIIGTRVRLAEDGSPVACTGAAI